MWSPLLRIPAVPGRAVLLLRSLAACALAAAAWADVRAGTFTGPASQGRLALSATAVGAVLVALPLFKEGWSYVYAGGAAATVSLVCSAAVHVSHAAIGVSSAYGAFEPAALLVVLAFVARRGPAACAAPVALLLAAAVVLRPLSVGVQEGSLAVAFGLTLVTVLVAGASVTARMVEADRRQRAHRIRLEQRIDLARDLHDHLAHHVAGIVVQAQGARAVAARRPDMVLPALQRIEETGAEALAAAILHRVTVESLTNIRKHARHCRHVSVHVRVRPHEAAVRITSDGTARLTSRPGYGLKDLRERVTLGGGTFRAEPTAEGDWQVRARLPLTTPGGRSVAS